MAFLYLFYSGNFLYYTIVPLYTVLYHLYGQSILKCVIFTQVAKSCVLLRLVAISFHWLRSVTNSYASIIDWGYDKLRSSIIAVYSVLIYYIESVLLLISSIPYYIIELLHY